MVRGLWSVSVFCDLCLRSVSGYGLRVVWIWSVVWSVVCSHWSVVYDLWYVSVICDCGLCLWSVVCSLQSVVYVYVYVCGLCVWSVVCGLCLGLVWV